MKLFPLFAAILMVIVMSSGCYCIPPRTTTTTLIITTTQTTAPTTSITMPSDKESCEALGGRWGRIGISPVESCNLPAKDVGKECSNQEDCEGACLAELTNEQYELVENGEVIEAKGRCSDRLIVVGCQMRVEDGKVYGLLCVD
ncbi:MAG: hypothetical protein V1703_04155 [Candidatus Altiarchaeota archaeon]